MRTTTRAVSILYEYIPFVLSTTTKLYISSFAELSESASIGTSPNLFASGGIQAIVQTHEFKFIHTTSLVDRELLVAVQCIRCPENIHSFNRSFTSQFGTINQLASLNYPLSMVSDSFGNEIPGVSILLKSYCCPQRQRCPFEGNNKYFADCL